MACLGIRGPGDGIDQTLQGCKTLAAGLQGLATGSLKQSYGAARRFELLDLLRGHPCRLRRGQYRDLAQGGLHFR